MHAYNHMHGSVWSTQNQCILIFKNNSIILACRQTFYLNDNDNNSVKKTCTMNNIISLVD